MPRLRNTPEQIEANRRYQATWYKNNRSTHYTRIKARTAKIKKWLTEYKSSLSCILCGESHPSTLDFHHRDANDKEEVISKVIIKGWGKEKILDEIAKCDVLCANCHRKLHFANRGKKHITVMGE